MPGTTETDDHSLHLIQHMDPFDGHHTTVLCTEHRPALMRYLRVAGIGCSATTAPFLSRCDDCESLKETP